MRTLLLLASLNLAWAQSARLELAPRVELPPVIDGNSPAFWADGEMFLFHSTGVPHLSSGPDQFRLGNTRKVQFDSTEHSPVWFEAAWRDTDGTVFLFYHHEPEARCGDDNLTAPKIGAALTRDNGATVQDLGIILDTGYPIDCESRNRFFSGGHGDFSVVLDRNREFFYFYFTNYSGPLSAQGVVTARLPFIHRHNPAGHVQKWFAGAWDEPGLGGRLTAVFPARVSWQSPNTNSYWGPALHYNTHLDRYVMMMNRSCCEPGWPQAGIDITFNDDLANPYGWKQPRALLYPTDILVYPGYYPQVLGLDPENTDALAGERARLYLMGVSEWEIVFSPEDELFEDPNLPCANPDIPCLGW
jgi:hypothetical protein